MFLQGMADQFDVVETKFIFSDKFGKLGHSLHRTLMTDIK